MTEHRKLHEVTATVFGNISGWIFFNVIITSAKQDTFSLEFVS